MPVARRGIIAALALLASTAIVASIFWGRSHSTRWQERSAAFADQINSLGSTLGPGETGAVVVVAPDADGLVLLPCYAYEDAIEQRISGQSKQLLDDLVKLSRDERMCPALVWLHGGQIVSVNHVTFNVGTDMKPTLWRLDETCRIEVAKESQSPNGFLSLYFLDDHDGR
jgi:hypothetical protein